MQELELEVETQTFWQELADIVANFIGSWTFLFGQSAILCLYVCWNIYSHKVFDPYPFVFLNLILSFQAAYASPIIILAQNRKEEVDRKRVIDIFQLEKADHAMLLKLVKHLDNHFDVLNSRIDKLEKELSKIDK